MAGSWFLSPPQHTHTLFKKMFIIISPCGRVVCFPVTFTNNYLQEMFLWPKSKVNFPCFKLFKVKAISLEWLLWLHLKITVLMSTFRTCLCNVQYLWSLQTSLLPGVIQELWSLPSCGLLTWACNFHGYCAHLSQEGRKEREFGGPHL